MARDWRRRLRTAPAVIALIAAGSASAAYAIDRPLDQVSFPSNAELTLVERHAFDASVVEMTAEELIGRDVVNLSNERLGYVNDIVQDDQGGGLYAVVATGGFMGLGEHEITVPLQQLQLAEDTELRLQSTITQSQVERIAAFNRHRYQPVTRDVAIIELAGISEEQLARTENAATNPAEDAQD
ncbi:hypothetical protein CAI21_11050 [Alkalilimnicola ehrlichii]|uniref:PRC-barrel domain-containing protein n=1 Tax=Alkalilimnicola ehrlichii TaxID=351052 RepID=A0A3E0X252_9GAMM|nr:PRC-barrel domain-containing protein [Alkalilimnicola ehrlichii]RFA28982.1 hypothetical protein CAI21_11050 [Alkalilimnicola ehrlichii]RFA38618.1 hypothetical protein CAL65_04600 [Alkalilimnicola ehrlichii]